MIAGTTGMTSEFIRQKEESMTNSLLYDFVNQMYLYGKEEEEAPKDKIFEAESKSNQGAGGQRKMCDHWKMFGLCIV